MNKDELDRMKAAELLALAGRRGVPVKKRMKKSDVVEAIAAATAKGHVHQAAEGPRPPAEQPASGVQDAVESGMQQAMEESKYYTGPAPQAGCKLPSELPHGYGDNMITLMVRDPYWAYAFWEVTQKKLDSGRAGLGEAGQSSYLALRVYDITGISFDGRNAHRHFDTGIYERVGDWFLDVARPGRSFVADLGLKTHDGRFVTLARSNAITTPRDGVSDVLDEEWVMPEGGFERIFALSGGYGMGMSSADVRLASAQRIPFGIASPGMGSLALMSPIKKRQRSFWYTLNAELIVYGATEPDAKVTLQGSQVNLRPDGTFTARFALPDGEQAIPVSFTSSDGVDTGWITPEIRRNTSY